MTNALTTFDFNALSVRVIEHEDQPWFHATDVCRVLGIKHTPTAVAKLEPSVKCRLKLQLRGQAPTLVNEAGLYELILQSRKPEAREFKQWVTGTVLPAIRKDGAYIMGEEKVVTGEMSEDELVLKAYDILKAKVERLTTERDTALQQKNSMAQVTTAHRRLLSDATRTFTDVNQSKVKSDLCELGFLYRKVGTKAYRVYRKFNHLFEEKFGEHNGSWQITVTTEGMSLLADLHAAGKLTLKKGK